MLLMNGLDLPSGEHTKNYRKVPAFIGESTIFAAILYSHVSFPEGKGNLQETMFFLSFSNHGGKNTTMGFTELFHSLGRPTVYH